MNCRQRCSKKIKKSSVSYTMRKYLKRKECGDKTLESKVSQIREISKKELGSSYIKVNTSRSLEQETVSTMSKEQQSSCASSESLWDTYKPNIWKSQNFAASRLETSHKQSTKRAKLKNVITVPSKLEFTNERKINVSQFNSFNDTILNESVLREDSKTPNLILENMNEHHSIKKRDKNLKSELVCEYCRKLFDRMSKLKEHLGTHTLPYICSKCDCRFGRASQLANHTKRNLCTFSKERSFKCEDCGKSFLQSICLKKHVQQHLEQDDRMEVKCFRCKVCGKVYNNLSELSGHEVEHIKKKSYKCEQCSRTFQRKTHLTRHQLTHLTQQKRLECAYCGETFVLKELLRVHIRKHLREAKWGHREEKSEKPNIKPEGEQVSVCQGTKSSEPILEPNLQPFPTKISNEVMNNYDKEPQRDVSSFSISTQQNMSLLMCPKCGLIFHWKTGLKRHLLTHREDHKKEALDSMDCIFYCDDCGKVFRSKPTLRRHVRQHISEKVHKREPTVHHTGLLFKDIVAIDDSMATASAENNYNCNESCSSSSQTSEFFGHNCSTSDQRPYVCHICDKSFMESRHLSRHMTVHFPPYRCQYCGRSFSRRAQWRSHEDRHGHLERFKREGYYWKKSQKLS